jgi:membrane associated rhomboid family serine protease
MAESRFTEVARKLKTQAMVLLSLLAVMWAIELLDALFLNQSLNQYGIQPRSLIGLRGIPLAPLLHNGLGHLAANTLPFLALGWLIMLRSQREFWLVTLAVVLVSGLGVWLVGRSSASETTTHLGASALIFGYLGFLLLRGYFERGALAVAISLLVGVFYGGLVWGVLPLSKEDSWEGHLCGLLTGVAMARLLTRRAENRSEAG